MTQPEYAPPPLTPEARSALLAIAMPDPGAEMRYRVRGIRPGGSNKIVTVDWFVRVKDTDGNEHDVTLLVDGFAVGARATDEEILEALDKRRLELGPQLKIEIPNPEANRGLIGAEG